MSTKKSPLLIYAVEGDVGTCFECPKDKKRPADYVVHYNISYADKEDIKEYKGVKKKGMERFLCRYCYRINWLNNSMKVDQSGQSEFTSVTIMEWKKLSYHHK